LNSFTLSPFMPCAEEVMLIGSTDSEGKGS